MTKAESSVEDTLRVASEITSLLHLACKGLLPMLDERRGVFCDRLVRDADGVHREGISERYTAMTLLGLNRYHRVGFRSPFAVEDMANTLLSERGWASDIGDVGLLVWLFAEVNPSELGKCLTVIDLASTFEHSHLVRSRHTMELAWFLTGVAKAVLAEPSQREKWRPLAQATYRLLLRNRGRSGLFGHRSSRVAPNAWRGWIGSFADQVYPIYALTNFARAFGVGEALDNASACADGICRAQGPLGQWWWHYSATSGRVVQRYPVYSVHQEAMGPMALLEVARANGRDMTYPILHGLRWILGQNEVGQDMRDLELGVVWRSVRFPGKARMVYQEVANWARAGSEPAAVEGLTILRECRPYELGWLLFAFSEFETAAA